MHELELILPLLTIIVLVGLISRRLWLAPPILLVLLGLYFSASGLYKGMVLNPNRLFFLFLPPVLFYSAWGISWKDLKNNSWIMILMALGLVLATSVAVACVVESLIPGVSIACAFLLGAIVAPPDAVAASAVIRQFKVPRKIVVILEGESLLNDATALVAYGFALNSVTTGTFSLQDAIQHFIYAGLGGVFLGVFTASMISVLWARLDDFPLEMALSLLIPYSTYLTAEHLHLSGVLAVVSSGLYLSWRSPQMLSANSRLHGRSTWDAFMFILQHFLFLWMGLQLPYILKALSQYPPESLLEYSAIVSVVVIAVRMLWVFAFAYIPRFLSPALRAIDPYPRWQNVFLVAWSGMRGVVSLAAAFALPFSVMLPSGNDLQPFPHRDLILFLTFSVILSTLIIQGSLMPLLIRWLNITDSGVERCNELHARIQSSEGALRHLETLISENHLSAEDDVAIKLRYHYQHLLQIYKASAVCREDGTKNDLPEDIKTIRALENDVLRAERDVVLSLWRENIINDDILHTLENELDLQEVQINRQLHREPV